MKEEQKDTIDKVKSATQTARMGLKKMGKIGFDGNFIWPLWEQ